MDATSGSHALRRITINLPESLIIKVGQAQIDLRHRKQRISFSGMVDVALRELLETQDLAAVIRKHGGSARRA